MQIERKLLIFAKSYDMPITTSIILDTRYERKRNPGKYPVCLRVYDGRRKRKRLYQISYYNYRLYLTTEQYRITQLHRIRDNKLRELKNYLTMELERAESCVMQLRPFTFAGFERLWHGEDVAGTFKELAIEKRDTLEKYASKKKYDELITKIESFDKRELLPQDITLTWLKRFERFMQGQKLSRASIIKYMRYVRAVLNYAIDKGVMNERQMPFGAGSNSYTVGTPKQRLEKTLTQAELRKLFAYEAKPGSEKHFALTLFRLSFYLSGANPADLFRLTADNIHGNRIIFTRRKTADTSRTGRKVIATYSKVVEELFKAVHKPNSDYLIPLLHKGMSEKDEVVKINNKNVVINRNLQKIAKEIHIDKKITMGYARASFATILRDNGYSSEQIANLMGNSAEVVDKHYYGQADEEKINQIYNSLSLSEGGRASDE